MRSLFGTLLKCFVTLRRSDIGPSGPPNEQAKFSVRPLLLNVERGLFEWRRACGIFVARIYFAFFLNLNVQ